MTLDGCFKAYDIRGSFPNTLNERVARALGQGIGTFLQREISSKNHACSTKSQKPIHIVIGRDCRLSGETLSNALIRGLRSVNIHVHDIGMCGTEEIYFATLNTSAKYFSFNPENSISGGVMITGSHNPAHENGFKLVRANAVPIGKDSGLKDIQALTLAFLEENATKKAQENGSYTAQCIRQHFVNFLLDTVDIKTIKALQNSKEKRPLRIHADAGNGCAALVLRELMPHLPFHITIANAEPDGTFPNGVPNPLLPERRAATAQAVRENNADMGIAWDGDFDRCFFYDAEGSFIEGYYIVGLLAQSLLQDFPGESIIHDPRLVWNTQEIVKAAGGKTTESKSGHSYMKETMRRGNALYGGEMSAHHFFRHFAYADSGMIPWLLMAKLLLRNSASLKALLQKRISLFPCSGEINRKIANIPSTLKKLEQHYTGEAIRIEHKDGLTIECATWRCNIRPSNTEALLRLNIESRGDRELLKEKTEEILRIIE